MATIAWPLIVSTSSLSLLTFCDRMFLGWYSPDAFRAASPAGILCYTMLCGFIALAAYSGTFVAQFFGSKQYEKCPISTVQGVWISLISWPLLLTLIPVGLFFLKISGHGEAVYEHEKVYFSILMLGSVSQMLVAAISGFFSGIGKTSVVMWSNILGNIVNIFLNYCLVFGKFGFPELGTAGAALSSVIASWIPPGIMFALFMSKKYNNHFQTHKAWHWNKEQLQRILRYGGPSGIQLFLNLAAFSLFTLLLGRQGEAAHIASNMALSINLFAIMPMVGLGIATGILVGQYMGAKKPRIAERTGWTALKVGLIYTSIIVSTFIIFPDQYVRLLGQSDGVSASPEVYELCRWILVILAGWGLMDATNFIMSGALKGAGDTHFVLYYHTSVAWGVLAIGELILILWLKVGPITAWLWCLFYLVIIASGLFLRFKSGKWKHLKIIE